jgi:hypothetical protein
MKCSQAEELFSALYDEPGRGARTSAVRTHLDGCAACSAAFDRFVASIDALRAAEPPATSAALRDAILAAVDDAVLEGAGRDDEFRRVMLVAGERFAARERRRRVATHALAILAGAAAAVAWFVLAPGERPGPIDDGGGSHSETVEASVPEPALPRIVERVVTVPHYVERVVERVVEVPTIVEVPGPERVILRGPLVRWEGGALARALDGLAGAIATASRERSEALLVASRERERAAEVEAAPAKLASATLGSTEAIGLPGNPPAASVRVRRDGGSVRLETRGALGEVVPVLLSKLAAEDADVVALVVRHLDSIRRDAEADPLLASRLATPGKSTEADGGLWSLFGAHEEPEPGSWEEGWRAWWELNRDVVSRAHDRAPRAETL